MQEFLEIYYKETPSEGVGGLLGEMRLLQDGMPSDPVAWDNWMESVQKALKQQ